MGLGSAAADGARLFMLILLGIVIVALSFAAGVHSQSPRLQAWRAYDSKRFSQRQFEERLTARYEQIESKFMWLDAYTRLRSPQFTEDQRGITTPRQAKWARAGLDFTFQRNMSKSYFVYDMIQRARRRGKKMYATCSLGFNAGHTALLLMESAPEATLSPRRGEKKPPGGPEPSGNSVAEAKAPRPGPTAMEPFFCPWGWLLGFACARGTCGCFLANWRKASMPSDAPVTRI